MKKLLLFCIFISIGINMNSQTEDFICATPDYFTPAPIGTFSYSIDPNDLGPFSPVVFNVYFWGINDDNGDGTNKLSQTMALKTIAELNIKFNSAKIFFKYSGYDFINSTDFHIIYGDCDDPNDPCWGHTISDFNSFLADNPDYIKNDAINFYFPNSTHGFAGYGSFGYLRAIINPESIENSGRVVNHEIGHVLGLFHTHAGWNPDEGEDSCEHVTRDKYLPGGGLNPDFNADVAGDEVVDTAAVPDFRNEKCAEEGYPFPYTDCPEVFFYAYLNTDCQYIGNGDDCLYPPIPYDISEADVKNLMAYSSGTCSLDLTTGQKIRMRDVIEDNQTHYDRAITTVPSLYEPYSGEYLNGILYTDNQPRFQPGFDYKYLNCYPDGGFPQPSEYINIDFSYSENGLFLYSFDKNIDPQYYNTIIHNDGYAIRIEQLEFQPRKCWNTGIAKEGSVIKFNDGVFNTNVTITPQDSTAINNEQLIDDLQPGLYNIIKTYLNGREEETVILKENN